MVRATLKNGESVTLAAEEGTTPDAVRARVADATKGALTGSAMPDVTLKTTDGDHILYAAVERLEPDPEP